MVWIFDWTTFRLRNKTNFISYKCMENGIRGLQIVWWQKFWILDLSFSEERLCDHKYIESEFRLVFWLQNIDLAIISIRNKIWVDKNFQYECKLHKYKLKIFNANDRYLSYHMGLHSDKHSKYSKIKINRLSALFSYFDFLYILHIITIFLIYLYSQ